MARPSTSSTAAAPDRARRCARPLPQRGVDDLRGTEQRAVDDLRRGAQPRAPLAPTMEALPAESLAEVVLCLLSWKNRADIFPLRCASTFCRDAVRRGIAAYDSEAYSGLSIEGLEVVRLDRNWRGDTRPIVARGRIFGHACRDLTWYTAEGVEKIAVSALRSFVADTNGGLDSIDLRASTISIDELLEICRKSPRLTCLQMGNSPLLKLISYESIDKFAAAVSQACPSLEFVDFRSHNKLSLISSMAEDYAMHFPNLKRLSLAGSFDTDDPYVPVDYDRIVDENGHVSFGYDSDGEPTGNYDSD